MVCIASCRRWCAAKAQDIAYVDVVDRPRHSGVSNYGFFDRPMDRDSWISAGVWWLIRRKKPTPQVTEVLLMLIQYGQALGDYLYDVFVAKFDFWLRFRPDRAIAVHRTLPGAVDFERARRHEA